MSKVSASRSKEKKRSGVTRFEDLSEVTTAAIFLYGGGRMIHANPAFEKLLGYSADELGKIKLLDLFPENARRTLRASGLDLRLKSDDVISSEVQIIKKDGIKCWVDLTLTPVEFQNRRVLIGTAFDVTERQRAGHLQDATFRIAQAADRSRTFEDLFPIIHSIIGEVMVAKNFYIALIEDDGEKIYYPYYIDEYDPPAEPHSPGRGLTEWILKHGISLLVDQSKQIEMESLGEVELVGTPSEIWVGVPLSVDGRVIGVMVVQDYSDPNAYGEPEQRMLEFVSSQVAMAIQRKRAEEALKESEIRFRRRAEELSTLYETTRDLALQQNLDTLLNTIADRVVALIGSPGCSIYLYSKERNDLEAVISRGWPGIVGLRLPVGEGVAGQVAKTLKPLIIDDHRKWEKRSQKFASIPATAVAEVPMIYRGDLVGVLTVFELAGSNSTRTRKFSQVDVDLLAVFAATAAGAVYNTRLFEETRQRLVEIELLYQASLAASQIHSLRSVAQRIVDALDHLMNWKGSIWISEEGLPVLLAFGSKGLTGNEYKAKAEIMNGLIKSMDDGIVGWVFRNGVTLRTGDVSTNTHYIPADVDTVSEICVPLRSGGKTMGCINVESAQHDAFTDHDERLLTTLANQASAALENARLFDETRRRAGRQSALNTIIMNATRIGADLDELLNTTIDQTLAAFNLDTGAIWLSTVPRGIRRIAVRGVPSSVIMSLSNSVLMGDEILNSTIAIGGKDPKEDPVSEMLAQLGIHGAIICPLMAEDRRIGGLAIMCPQSREWSSEETTFIEAIAGELGAAADRARLFTETRMRLVEFEAVNRVSTALRLAQSIDSMLPDLLNETLQTLETDTGCIWLFDDEKGILQQAVGRGWCTDLAQFGYKAGIGIPGTVYATSDILFSHDIALDPITPPQARELIPPGWSSVCIPIRTEQEAIGVLEVIAELPREFDGENARLLVTLADMAGSAIHRMQLNERTRRHAIELEERVASRTVELSDALSKAQEADRLKTEFIANINHELRTPLTNLVLYYQMLRSQPEVKTQERLDVIGRELQRLRNLIEDLLNLSRLDLQQVRFNPRLQDLNQIIRSLVEDRRALAEEHHLTLSVDLPPDIPRTLMDESLIVQVVSNLVTNALNYTPAGGSVHVRTMLDTRDECEWIGFSVEDTGPGIAAEEREHMFERFYRGKAGHTSGAPGTGLGLAIVKQVVDRHAGRIEVPEIEGRGAIFRVWLPVDGKETGSGS